MARDTPPRRLRTSARATPLGIDRDDARFRWEPPDETGAQTAYHIRVAADPAALPEDATVWDSGAVESAHATGVPYPGPSLEPETRYYWTVRVRNDNGDWSAWSEPTWFETGLDDWAAEWLAPAGEEYESTPAPAPVFRTTFEVETAPESARLYVAAGGTCDPRLNGRRVTERALDPGQSDYEERVLYATYDVTDAVREGTNGLAAVCGRERYAMTTENHWAWHDTPWQRDHPAVLAQLVLRFPDGSRKVVASDPSWRVRPSATKFDCLYTGEVYDAREAAAWSDPDLDDGDWVPAAAADPPAGELVPQTVQPIEPVGTVSPEAIEELDAPDADGYVVDFGTMVAGWVRLRVDAPAGTEIELVYGERLRDDGTVNVGQHQVDGQIQTDRYVCAGDSEPGVAGAGESEPGVAGEEGVTEDGVETWEPRFSYKGFRYVQLTGLPEPPTEETVTAVVAHTAVETDSRSDFECGDELLATLHENSRRALLNNLHSIPTDTPVFEKNGWTGDAQLTAETALYNFEMLPFYRKWLADVADAQRPTGEIPPIVPTSDWGYSDAPHGGAITGPNPAWDAAYVLIPWWAYRYCGARDLLARHYDGMKALCRFLGRYAEDGIVDTGLGDWLPPGDGEIQERPPEGPAIAATAYYYRTLDVVGEAAAALNRERDAAAFDARAEAVREAFNDTFLDPEAGVYATGEADEYRQTSNVLPLAFDLVPDRHRDAVAENLAADVRARDDHLNTGILGTKYLLGVLCDHGYVDLAYRVATQRTYPSWGHWIENGATSLYEAWELQSRSRNHHMAGSIDEWFYKHLAGIRPEDPGFETVEIAPHVPADLDSVVAAVDTVNGVIRSEWERDGDGIRLDVTLPANTGGVARVPGTEPTVSGNAYGADADARVADTSGEWTTIKLPAGSWSIRTS